LLRCYDFRLWPFATKIHVRSNVGNWGMTGLVMLIASFVDPDTLPKSGSIRFSALQALLLSVETTPCGDQTTVDVNGLFDARAITPFVDLMRHVRGPRTENHRWDTT
jgi:hypothetical protein